jgi:general secretion pathway protein N
VQWQIGPSIDFQTVAVGLKLELQSACCTNSPLQVFAAPTWQGLQLQSRAHTSQWPATWLVGLGAPWNTLQPEGQMQLRTQGLQWRQPWSLGQTQPKLSGEIELQWLQFSTRLSTLRPLGNYRVVVKGGDTMQVTLDTLEGSLQLQGHGEWQQGRLRFRGEAKAQADAEAAVSNLLNVLGQRRGNVSFMELG